MSPAAYHPTNGHHGFAYWGDKRVVYPPGMYSIMEDDRNGLNVERGDLKANESVDEPILDDSSALHSTMRDMAEDLVDSLQTIDTASKTLNSGLEEATTDYLQRIEEADREIMRVKAESLRRIEEAEQEVRYARLESLQRMLKAEHDVLQALMRIRQVEQDMARQKVKAPPCRLRTFEERFNQVKERFSQVKNRFRQQEQETAGTPDAQTGEVKKTQEALEAELAWLERLCRSRMARADEKNRDTVHRGSLTRLLRFCEVP